MIKLKDILQEHLLVELSEKTTLYHRSFTELKVGDIIKPKMDKTGKHWLKGLPVEILLEEYRKENYPNRPSRLDCIYSSLIPRSRFVDKGNLYAVKPIGKMFITDSLIIDEIGEKFSRETMNFYEQGIRDKDIIENPQKYIYYMDHHLAKRYWEGDIKGIKNKLTRIEVLSESAEVVEVIGEDKLNVGDTVEITKPNKIKVSLTLYLEDEDAINKYKLKNDDKFNKYIEGVHKLFSGDVETKLSEYQYGQKSGNVRFDGYLDAGTKLKIFFLESVLQRPGEYGDYYEDDRRKEGKYKWMKFEFYLNNKFYGSRDNLKKNGLPNYTMQFFNHWYKGDKTHVYDISKYMKKLK